MTRLRIHACCWRSLILLAVPICALTGASQPAAAATVSAASQRAAFLACSIHGKTFIGRLKPFRTASIASADSAA